MNDSKTVVRRRTFRILGFAAVIVWAFAVGYGIEYIWAYSATPGVAAAGSQSWPGSKLISPQPGKATLIMFVHPRCPCSRASVAELQVALERAPQPVSTWVLFLRPEGTDDAWESTPLWRTARSIPDVNVLTDSDGTEAARFGASTSGHVVLYDSQGRFLFGGGITASRGHVGDNAGLQSVLTLLAGGAVELPAYPVFGCSLHD